MVNGIHGPNNNFRVNGNSSMRPPVRKIVIRNLMGSTALKHTLLQWHMGRNPSGPEMLNRTLSLKMPEIESTKLEFCRMHDNEIIDEAGKMIGKFIDDHKYFLGQDEPPTLLAFMQGTRTSLCPTQFYSNYAIWSSATIDEITSHIGPIKREKFLNDIKNAYRNVLVFTSAMEIMSKRHDFTIAIHSWLVQHFPQMDKEISPWNYLDVLDSEDIFMTAQLLKHINEEAKMEIKKVKFDAIKGSDVVAHVNKDLVVINLPSMPKLNYSITPATIKRIITEK